MASVFKAVTITAVLTTILCCGGIALGILGYQNYNLRKENARVGPVLDEVLTAVRQLPKEKEQPREPNGAVRYATNQFRVTFSQTSDYANIDLRARLVSEAETYQNGGLTKREGTKLAEPAGSTTESIGRRISDIEGISQVMILPYEMTVVKAHMYKWQEIEKKVVEILREIPAGPAAPITEDTTPTHPSPQGSGKK